MKKIKDFIDTLLVIFILSGILYLIFAIGQYEINLKNWDPFGRTTYSTIIFIISCIVFSISYNKSLKK